MDNILKKIKQILWKYRTIIIVIFILLLLFIYFNKMQKDSDITNLKNFYTSNNTSNISQEKNDSKIVVHIDGEVKNPGVYYINNNCILNDLITICGGFTDEANTKNVNLASKLSDGEKIYIYSFEEEENTYIQSSDNGTININKATKEQLKTLPGIGDSTAQKILNYRQSNGNFKRIEDITNVNGIGEAKFNNISTLICI